MNNKNKLEFTKLEGQIVDSIRKDFAIDADDISSLVKKVEEFIDSDECKFPVARLYRIFYKLSKVCKKENEKIENTKITTPSYGYGYSPVTRPRFMHTFISIDGASYPVKRMDSTGKLYDIIYIMKYGIMDEDGEVINRISYGINNLKSHIDEFRETYGDKFKIYYIRVKHECPTDGLENIFNVFKLITPIEGERFFRLILSESNYNNIPYVINNKEYFIHGSSEEEIISKIKRLGVENINDISVMNEDISDKDKEYIDKLIGIIDNLINTFYNKSINETDITNGFIGGDIYTLRSDILSAIISLMYSDKYRLLFVDKDNEANKKEIIAYYPILSSSEYGNGFYKFNNLFELNDSNPDIYVYGNTKILLHFYSYMHYASLAEIRDFKLIKNHARLNHMRASINTIIGQEITKEKVENELLDKLWDNVSTEFNEYYENLKKKDVDTIIKESAITSQYCNIYDGIESFINSGFDIFYKNYPDRISCGDIIRYMVDTDIPTIIFDLRNVGYNYNDDDYSFCDAIRDAYEEDANKYFKDSPEELDNEE